MRFRPRRQRRIDDWDGVNRRQDEADRRSISLGRKLDRNFLSLILACVLLIGAGLIEFQTRDASRNAQHAATTAKSAAATAKSATAENKHLADREARDEHTDCVIQARGLPAGHHLAHAMGDISELLQALPPAVAGESRMQLHLRAIALDLRSQTHAYATIESKQPRKRTCS